MNRAREYWNRLRFLFRRRHQPVPVPPTRREELLELAEAACKAVDLLGFKLEDAWQEGLLKMENRIGHPACDAHISAAFQCTRVRDELLIELQRDKGTAG